MHDDYWSCKPARPSLFLQSQNVGCGGNRRKRGSALLIFRKIIFIDCSQKLKISDMQVLLFICVSTCIPLTQVVKISSVLFK